VAKIITRFALKDQLRVAQTNDFYHYNQGIAIKSFLTPIAQRFKQLPLIINVKTMMRAMFNTASPCLTYTIVTFDSD